MINILSYAGTFTTAPVFVNHLRSHPSILQFDDFPSFSHFLAKQAAWPTRFKTKKSSSTSMDHQVMLSHAPSVSKIKRPASYVYMINKDTSNEAFWDTGGSTLIMSTKLADSLNVPLIDRGILLTVTVLHTQIQVPHLTVTVPFTFAGSSKVFTQTFIVYDATLTLLLGWDFIQLHQFNVSTIM